RSLELRNSDLVHKRTPQQDNKWPDHSQSDHGLYDHGLYFSLYIRVPIFLSRNCGGLDYNSAMTVVEPTSLRVDVGNGVEVLALLGRPADARWLMVLGHGAGAGMRHPFMGALANELANVGVATFRYQFPYMEEKRRVPDSPPVLTATVAAAVRTAAEEAPGLPVLAGGKSMGGRMTSQAAAEDLLPGVRGL